jgi:glycogen debranching enzyme
MKRDDCFLVFDSHGDIGASPGGPDGLFNCDTRYLSHFELLINGLQPLLLGSNLSDDNCVLSVDLTNPDIYYDKRILLQKNLLHVARTVFVWRSTLFHRFAVRNFSANRVMLLLSITFENDFADVFEVRGTQRARRGAVRSLVEGNGAEFVYLGLDGKRRRTRIVFEPTPTHLSPSLASFQLDLEPHKSVSLFGTISCDLDRPEPPPFLKSLRSAHRELKRMTKVGTEIETSNQVFNEVLRRATADLAILLTHTPQGPYPYAGIPWYSTTFGRDGLITAMQPVADPRGARRAEAARVLSARTTIRNPRRTGKSCKRWRAKWRRCMSPVRLYYGSVDLTSFVIRRAVAQTTGDPTPARPVAGDRLGAGLMTVQATVTRTICEYFATPGLQHGRTLRCRLHADGRLAEGPIAPPE